MIDTREGQGDEGADDASSPTGVRVEIASATEAAREADDVSQEDRAHAAKQLRGEAGGVLGMDEGAIPGKGAAVEDRQTIDLADVKSVSPNPGVQTGGELMTGLQSAGVHLAKWLLTIIGISLASIVLLVGLNEWRRTTEIAEVANVVKTLQTKLIAAPPNDPTLPDARKEVQDLMRQVTDATQAQRAFWIQFAQMILLNLLLPVLTAILGYVFGANSLRQ